MYNCLSIWCYKNEQEEKAITKCDLCFERVKTGKLPACVEICPTKALKFKTPAEESADIRKTAANKFLVDYVN